MKELNEEIKVTVEQMRGDIDDSTYSQLQSHLYKLLEMKRDVIRKQLAEYSQEEPDKLLTVEELKAGGWWCADTSAECAKVLEANFWVKNKYAESVMNSIGANNENTQSNPNCRINQKSRQQAQGGANSRHPEPCESIA